MARARRIGWTILVGAGLVLAATPGWAVDPKLLPSNTELVFSVNIKQILESEVVKAQKEVVNQLKAALQNQIPGEDQAQKYLERMGLDPFRDLTAITVAHPGTKDPDALFIIIEGTFNPAKFAQAAEDAAKDNGDILRISRMGNVKVYEVTPPGEKRFFVSLLEDKAVVISPNQDTFNEVLGRAVGTKTGGLKTEIRDLLKTTNDKQSLSFVVTGGALARQAENAKIPNSEMVGPVLQAIEGISAAVTVSKNINFQLGIGSKDDATAKKLVASGNAGLLGLRIFVASKAKENEQFNPLVDVMNSLRVTASGNNTVLTGEVSYENLEKLIKNFNQLKQP
jgi:hypothetical protein